jgi:endonuclease/exonuclease/phosphatase family metal-dependent hydrolase
LKTFNKIVLFLNYLAAFSLLLSVLAQFINPAAFWFLSFFGLAFPILILINAVFICYWLIALKWHIIISVIVVILSIPTVTNFWIFSHHKSSNIELASAIKVMSYNVQIFDLYNWTHNKETRKSIFSLLQEQNADILCMQEYYTSEAPNGFNNTDTLVDILQSKNVHTEFTTTLRDQDHWGIATFSKYPIVTKGKIVFNTKSNNICIYTDVLIGTDTVRIYNLHFQSVLFGKKDYKFIDELTKKKFETEDKWERSQNLVSRLKTAFEKRAIQAEIVLHHMATCRYPIILCGDFNDTPASYVYKKISNKLSDSFVESGSGIGKTFNGNLPALKIDYIFMDSTFQSLNSVIEYKKLSDHYPIITYLKKK